MCLQPFLLLALTLPGAEAELKRFSYTEPHMGTRFKIILYAPDSRTAEQARTEAFARIAQLEQIMSDYRPTSELMQLCARAGGAPVPVSKELFYVLQRAQKVASQSEGAFDVTVGPIVRLWRLARKDRKLPDQKILAEALARVGYQKVTLDEKQRTVKLQVPGMQLDLGGIAKGYSADEALKVLRKHGIDRALVVAGGDIAVSGPPPGSDGWTVGIAPLEDPEQEPERFLTLKHAAVSTSGDAEQFLEIDGKRYSHVVDPRTGVGLLGRRSVTVVAPDGITADSLTKVVYVLGPEKGMALLKEWKGASCLVVSKNERGGETVTRSPNFPSMRESADKP